MKHLAVYTPTASGINVWLYEWMTALLKRPGLRITTGIEVGRPTMSSRNRLCLRILEETDADLFMTVDSDQVPYTDAEKRESGFDWLLEDIARPEVDVVSILTVRRTERGPEPVLMKSLGDSDARLYAEILQKPQGLHDLGNDGVMGGAGILMKRRVLERFYDESVLWFKDVYQEKRGERFDPETKKDLYGTRIVGHDTWFFKKCHEFGFRCWVDTRVLWGHLKEVDIRDEFVRDMKDATRIARLERELRKAKVVA